MFKPFSTQATAFGLATLVTLASLASMGALADTTAATANAAAAADRTPVKQVVVVGQKVARS
jgi:hypothetical protein